MRNVPGSAWFHEHDEVPGGKVLSRVTNWISSWSVVPKAGLRYFDGALTDTQSNLPNDYVQYTPDKKFTFILSTDILKYSLKLNIEKTITREVLAYSLLLKVENRRECRATKQGPCKQSYHTKIIKRVKLTWSKILQPLLDGCCGRQFLIALPLNQQGTILNPMQSMATFIHSPLPQVHENKFSKNRMWAPMSTNELKECTELHIQLPPWSSQ